MVPARGLAVTGTTVLFRSSGSAANRPLHAALLAGFLLILGWSGFHPKDTLTWFLEVFPAIGGAVILALLYPQRRLTDLVLVLVFVHAAILCVGGHYTYAEVPAFNWLRDEFGLARNYYDRVGHFAQGFVPAMVAAILRRNLGEKKSFELLTQGFEYSAEDALSLGLINAIFDEDGFDDAALEYASVYTKVSGSAVAMTKRLLYGIDGSDLSSAIEQGVKVNAEARMTEDCKKGIARFLEK